MSILIGIFAAIFIALVTDYGLSDWQWWVLALVIAIVGNAIHMGLRDSR